MPPNNRATRAFRNDFQTHVDETAVTMLEEDRVAEQAARDQEMSELNSIASLKNHPGWKMIKKSFQKKIDDIRSGKILDAAILDSTTTDEDLGKLTRTTNLVAKELETLLATVEAASLARDEELNDKTKRP